MLLQSQTWVHSPMHNKVSLLTLGSGEESVAFIAGTQQGEQTASAPNTWIPSWASRKCFKDQVREGVAGYI